MEVHTKSSAAKEYDAFGNLIPNSSTGTWIGRLTYQGQAWMEIGPADASKRLLLSPTRIYDPVTGRFLQNEPLLGTRPMTHYLYSNQNPVRFVDPLGLTCGDADSTAPQACKVAPPKESLTDPSGIAPQQMQTIKDWLNSQKGQTSLNAQDLFPGRSTVDAIDFVNYGYQNPSVTVVGDNLQGQLVTLGQMQSQGYTGGPYAIVGGPGYMDEWGFQHQTFCMSCHDPINPVAQARLGVAAHTIEWWQYAPQAAMDLLSLLELAGASQLPKILGMIRRASCATKPYPFTSIRDYQIVWGQLAARERAAILQAALPKRTAGSVTMGATYYFDAQGIPRIGIASSEPGKYIRRELFPKLFPWERVAPGVGDAEAKLFYEFYGEGTAAGRDACNPCQRLLDNAGVDILSGRRKR